MPREIPDIKQAYIKGEFKNAKEVNAAYEAIVQNAGSNNLSVFNEFLGTRLTSQMNKGKSIFGLENTGTKEFIKNDDQISATEFAQLYASRNNKKESISYVKEAIKKDYDLKHENNTKNVFTEKGSVPREEAVEIYNDFLENTSGDINAFKERFGENTTKQFLAFQSKNIVNYSGIEKTDPSQITAREFLAFYAKEKEMDYIELGEDKFTFHGNYESYGLAADVQTGRAKIDDKLNTKENEHLSTHQKVRMIMDGRLSADDFINGTTPVK